MRRGSVVTRPTLTLNTRLTSRFPSLCFAAPQQEPEKFQEHFARYLANDFDPTELEDNMEGVLEVGSSR